MHFEACPLPGAWLITQRRMEDERGYFARTYCEAEFAARGLHTRWPQCNESHNAHKHTLRGMHWQAAPHAEVKLVRCVSGAVHDVIVDLRPDSPTRFQSYGVDLSDDNGRMLYIPEGFAHGFITLTDNARVLYQMGACYEPGAARGARYNDPAFRIYWPHPPAVISERDRTYPDYED